MENGFDEIICIGRHETKAVFVDEAGELCYKEDPEYFYENGDLTSYGSLIPFSSLPEDEKKTILNLILEL